MLLQSIELINFRQFQHEIIEFAQAPDKNVTLIIGDNGAGKTSLAQAFFWCLYGEVSFQDKILLNRNHAINLVPGESDKVSVRICLKHGGRKYRIIRSQKYTKNFKELKPDNAELNIEVTDEKGNTNWIGEDNPRIKDLLMRQEINDIIPKELSKYFFFDGEKIESLSKEISSGRKSNTFVEAVNSLTGLKGILKAIEHLDPSSKRSVVGHLNIEYLSGGSEKIKRLTEIIEENKEQLRKFEEEVNDINNELTENDEYIIKYSEELKQYDEASKLQNDREKAERELKNYTEHKYDSLDSMFNEFRNNVHRFVCQKPLIDVLELLNECDLKGKDIPNIHINTIKYLFERGICICGTPLVEGSEHYKCLENLCRYIPPESAASAAGTFVKNVKIRNQGNHQLVDSVKEYFIRIGEQDKNIECTKVIIDEITKKLSGDDVRSIVRNLNSRINALRTKNNQLNSRKYNIGRSQGQYTSTIKSKEDERKDYAMKDRNNRKIEIAQAYAKALHDKFLQRFKDREKLTKDKLEKYINENFQKFFEGGIFLQIDSKYAIRVTVHGDIDNLETSTGQGIAVIFAFLSAIIKIAKENEEGNGTYPIVMDAPLSTLDKSRINSVCLTLPKIADQVIVFIKDTDGEIAEKSMADRVGKKLKFYKMDQYTTKIG